MVLYSCIRKMNKKYFNTHTDFVQCSLTPNLFLHIIQYNTRLVYNFNKNCIMAAHTCNIKTTLDYMYFLIYRKKVACNSYSSTAQSDLQYPI